MAYVRTFDFELDGYPDDSFRVVLDEATYEVRFMWNERDESWFFSMGDVGTDPTFITKLTCFVDILAPYRYRENLPEGNLVLYPLRDIRTRVGRYNVGPLAGIIMTYASREEDVEEID